MWRTCPAVTSFDEIVVVGVSRAKGFLLLGSGVAATSARAKGLPGEPHPPERWGVGKSTPTPFAAGAAARFAPSPTPSLNGFCDAEGFAVVGETTDRLPRLVRLDTPPTFGHPRLVLQECPPVHA